MTRRANRTPAALAAKLLFAKGEREAKAKADAERLAADEAEANFVSPPAPKSNEWPAWSPDLLVDGEPCPEPIKANKDASE